MFILPASVKLALSEFSSWGLNKPGAFANAVILINIRKIYLGYCLPPVLLFFLTLLPIVCCLFVHFLGF